MDELIQTVVAGDARAWQTLWSASEPTIWAVTGLWQLTGPVSRREDDRKNIVVEVMDRLRADDFRRLRAYLASASKRESSSFRTWLATVTSRAAIDYVRAHPEYHDLRTKGDEQRWARFVPWQEGCNDAGNADPARLAAASQMLSCARAELRHPQLAALVLWLQGEDDSGIAAQVGLDGPEAARRLVRSALKRMRDRFRTDSVDANTVPDGEGLG